MSGDLVLFLVLGAAAGGFINGLSGTGTALFALGFYLVALDPVRSVAIVACLSVIVGIQGLWIVRRDIFARPGRVARFVIPGLLGVPLGLGLLQVIAADTLRLGIACMLILYGGYFGFRAALPAFSRPTPVVDVGIGLIGGVLGGAAAVSGAIPQIWLSLRPWAKAEVRAVLQPFNVAVLGTTITILATTGAFDRVALNALLITVPVGLVAAQVGIAVFHRLSDAVYRRFIILLTLAMGIGIMISTLT